MTTKLTLAQCPRCRQYTLAGDDGGFAVAVDVAPMGRDAYIAGLMGGVELYRVDSVPGRPSLARTWSPGGKDPSFDDSGAQRGTEGLLHRAHGCGAPAKSQKAVSVASGPPQAPATPGAGKAGSHQPAAPVSGAGAAPCPSPVPPATRRLSSPPVLGPCNICGRRVQPGQSYWSITHGRDWVDGGHEECP